MAQAVALPQKDVYVAYSVANLTAAERATVITDARRIGFTPVQDEALDREGLLVLGVPDRVKPSEEAVKAFSRLTRVPVREYRGVLSVPSGNFYLRFKANVPPTLARQRIQALGFKVLTPLADSSSLLVVEGTGQPADRDRELAKLQKLHELLYVAPDDIPLPSGAR
jgi:hypothetical protein